MKIAVLDYGLGNINSVKNMFFKIGADVRIESNPANLADYSAVILPGVGSFDAGVRSLKSSGFESALNDYFTKRRGFILGICLGMQLLFDRSDEGKLSGLKFISGKVRRFDFSKIKNTKDCKIPHMGWNEITFKSNDLNLFTNFRMGSRFYFVHSYHVVCDNPSDVLATSHYGYEFICSIGRDKVFGAQFHPEKSHRFGIQFFSNFLNIVKNAS